MRSDGIDYELEGFLRRAASVDEDERSRETWTGAAGGAGAVAGARLQNGPVSAEMPTTGMLLCRRYRLENLVARGGNGAVYRAVDEMLGEVVAVKVLLLDGESSRPEAKANRIGFREEAISAMRLSHPKILRVYNYEVHAPWEFIVMEFVVGEPLSRYVVRKPNRVLSALETIQVGLDSLDGLAYAHGVGIIHNDIKPSNILLTRANAIKICDFGLASMAAAQKKSVITGTPGYMSPERIRGESGDARSDLYSLGATLWALGNGKTLFGSDEQALYGHLHSQPPASPYLPPQLHDVLMVALSKDPAGRYANSEEMRGALVGVRRVLEHHSRVFPLNTPSKVQTQKMEFVAPPPPPSPSLRALTPTPTTQPRHGLLPVAEADMGLTEISASSLIVEEPSLRSAPAVPAEKARPADDGMVLVPARELESAHGGKFEIAAFRLDRYPVTNEEYARFVEATGEVPPLHWGIGKPPTQLLRHPVVNVSYEQAARYAAWRKKRLPTGLEWEAAARPEGQRFPWGDEFDPARCQGPQSGGDGTAPVDAHPEGASPDGALDLVGNVWEWTAPDPRRKSDNSFAFVYGGSYKHPCASDGHIARTAVATGKSYGYLGFRCAADVKEDK